MTADRAAPPADAPVPPDPWAEHAAAYALGDLAADERAAFEAHLAGCARCTEEVREHAETLALLAESVAAAPPPALRGRVLAAVAGLPPALDVRTTAAPPDGAPSVVAPPAPAGDASPEASPRLRVVAGDAPARPAAPRTAPTAAAGRGGAPWLRAAALLLAGGLGAAGLGWSRERAARQSAETTAARAVAAARDAQRAAERQAANDAALAQALLAADARRARLAATPDAGARAGAAVQVVFAPEAGAVVVSARGLPAPPAGRAYQLWGVTPGQPPRSLGVFVPRPDGAPVLLRTADARGVDVGALAAITEEPATGSPGPTSAPFLAGAWGARGE